jgi:hypothetical protein
VSVMAEEFYQWITATVEGKPTALRHHVGEVPTSRG